MIRKDGRELKLLQLIVLRWYEQAVRAGCLEESKGGVSLITVAHYHIQILIVNAMEARNHSNRYSSVRTGIILDLKART